MRPAAANQELKTTCLFFFFKSVILNGVVAALFIFLSPLLLLAVFWHSVLCRSHARCSCAFCTCSNSPSPGEHRTALVLHGWRWWWWGAERSRQGWQHSRAGGSCWLCTSLCAAQRYRGPVEWPEPVQMLTSHGSCRTCWCSTLCVIWRNSVFSFPSFQEHQLMQFPPL